jgi:hypothetical protein
MKQAVQVVRHDSIPVIVCLESAVRASLRGPGPRNVQIFDRAQFPRNEDALRPSHLIVFHWIVAKIDDHGMENDLKPHAERDQISFRGPN